MPDLTPEANGTGTNGETGAERSLSDRMSDLGRRSGEARRRKREAKSEQSNRDVAEAEIRTMLESGDAKVRREGVRLLSYLEGKKQPLPELEPEPEREPGQGTDLAGIVDLARELGIEIATLDDVVTYAKKHDLVLRPRQEGEGVGPSSHVDPVPARPPFEIPPARLSEGSVGAHKVSGLGGPEQDLEIHSNGDGGGV